jgi:homoprotocatechuate degradation regulator HpaR
MDPVLNVEAYPAESDLVSIGSRGGARESIAVNNRRAGSNGPEAISEGFAAHLPTSLLRAREAVMRRFRPALRERGITEPQWRVLAALATVDDIPVLKLAHVSGVLGPSLARILRDLRERRLIVRRQAQGDLRSALISIDPEGRTLLEGLSARSRSIDEAVAMRLGPSRLERLLSLLRELETRLPRGGTLSNSAPGLKSQFGATGGPL